jgi:hypothetical protein
VTERTKNNAVHLAERAPFLVGALVGESVVGDPVVGAEVGVPVVGDPVGAEVGAEVGAAVVGAAVGAGTKLNVIACLAAWRAHVLEEPYAIAILADPSAPAIINPLVGVVVNG